MRMQRRSAFAAAALSAILLTTAGIVYESHSGKTAPDLSEALFLPPVRQRVHLYSGVKDASGKWATPASLAVDVVDETGIARLRYVVGKVGEDSEDITFKADGEHFASSQSYYPPDADAPVSSGRRPHVHRVYAVDHDVVTQEEDRATNGYLRKRMQLSDQGLLVDEYADDGITIVHELVTKKFRNYGEPEISIERKWRADSGHTLSYSDVRTPNSEGARTITEFDSRGHMLKLSRLPDWGVVSGTSITAWYPDTLNVRFQSHSDISTDTTTYFRQDGTKNYELRMSSYMTTVTYFDATGLHETLEQQWTKEVSFENSVQKNTWKLYSLTEVDEQGQPKRVIEHVAGGGRIWIIQTFNVTLDGIAYHEVDYDYDKDGELTAIRYWIKPVLAPPDKIEEQKPHTHPKASEPADETVLRVNLELDALPVPPPQRGPGGQ